MGRIGCYKSCSMKGILVHQKHVNTLLEKKSHSEQTVHFGPKMMSKSVFFTCEAIHFDVRSEKLQKRKRRVLHIFKIFLQSNCEGVHFLVTL